MSGSKKKSLRPTRNESRRFQSTDCGPGKYTGSENRWKWIKLRGWTTFVHFCSVEPSTHVSTNKQLRTQLSCLSPPKPEIQTNEASILWILDSAFRLTNYILVFSHWDFLILFTKVLKLRKLSKFRISSIPRIINLWFQTNTKSWSDARGDLVKKNSRSSTTSFSWKFKKINFWVSTWAIIN